VFEVINGKLVAKNVAAFTALNERLRDDYIREVQGGVDRWNRNMEKAGLSFRLKLPHKGFHRAIGNFAGHYISLDGEVLSKEAWKDHEHEWMPSPEDYKYVQSLMSGRVVELGKFANWIAPPSRGVNNQPLNFEYVRFN
jgi:benzoyl-CoA 2,3-epoxidase subunit B